MLKTIAKMDLDKINMDLVEMLLEWIIDGKHDYPPGTNPAEPRARRFIADAVLTVCFHRPGAILVFLPGLAEIKMLYEQLMCNRMFNDRGTKRLCGLPATLVPAGTF